MPLPSRLAHVALIGTLLLACAGGAPSASRRAWVQVSTPNFEIHSSLSIKETREVALDLERFHALIFLILGKKRVQSPVPSEIYLFGRRYEYSDFAKRNTAGFFSDGMRSNLVTAVKGSGIELSSIMNHEYVHFVLRNASAAQYPRWYDEGFAEFLSSTPVKDDRIWVGAAPRHRVDSFRYRRWLAIERVVSAGSYADFRTDEELEMFYAQSWALVHHLTLQRGDERNMNDDLARYLELVGSGEPAPRAFAQAFGASASVTGQRIRRTLNGGGLRRIGIPLEALALDELEPRVRPLERSEISVKLGQLALKVRKGELAQRYFEVATRLAPDDARAQAGLGDAYKFQGRYEEARPYFDRSIELAPDDALTQLDYAEYLHDLARQEDQTARAPELLRGARAHYVKAWKLAPEIPETYAMYGSTYLPKGQDASKCRSTLIHAHRLLPSNTDILDLLAACHVAIGDLGAARRLVDRVVTWSTHSTDREETIRRRMEELVDAYYRTPADVAAGSS